MPKIKDRRKTVDKARKFEEAGGAIFEPVHEGKYSADMADKIASDLGKAKFNPHLITEKIIEFGKVLTGMELYDYQLEPTYRIIYSVVTVEGAEISLLFSRQSGKTEAISFVIVTLCVILPTLAKFISELDQYKSGIRIGLFAPQGEQVDTTYGRAMMRISSEIATLVMSDPEIGTELTSTVNLRLTNGSLVRGQIASKVSKIESKTYDLIVCVAEDTNVVTLAGDKKISEVKRGDFVQTLTENGREWDEVIRAWKTGEKETFKLLLQDGTFVEATDNHLIYTNFGWREVRWIKNNYPRLTIYCYLCSTQIHTYEQGAVDNRESVGRYVNRISDQRIKEPTYFRESQHQTKGICGFQIPTFKGLVYRYSSGRVREQKRQGNSRGLTPLQLPVFHSLPSRNSILSFFSLQRGEENGFYRMVKSSWGRGYSLLVHGRWDIEQSISKYRYEWILLRRAGIIGEKIERFFCEFLSCKGGKVFSSEHFQRIQRNIYGTNSSIYSPNVSIQDVDTSQGLLPNLRKSCEYAEPSSRTMFSGMSGDCRQEEETIFPLYGKCSIASKQMEADSRESVKGYRIQPIISVESTGVKEVWDITTKRTHSFLANGILVHNCEEAQDLDTYIVQKSIEPMLSACVCGDTLIYDKNGVRTEIGKYRGDTIVGYAEETKSIEVDTVTWGEKRSQLKESYHIEFKTGRVLRCSYDHPLLVRRRTGQRKMVWLETKDIIPGIHVACADKVAFFFGRERMFDPRMVGMLIGDGSYRYDGMVRYCTCDDELRDYVRAKYEFKSYNTYRTGEGKLFEDGTVKGLCGELRKIGIYGQTKSEKTLPSNIDSYYKWDIKELIGGLFDTDGYVSIHDNRTGTIGFTTMSERLIEDIRSLLEKFGIHGYIGLKHPTESSKGTKDYFNLTISEKHNILRFRKNFKFLVQYKNECLDSLCHILEKSRGKKDKKHPALFFDTVVSVIPIGGQEVFNLTANTNHTYLANGVVTHNTNGTLCKIGTTGTSKNHFWSDIQENKRLSRLVKDPRLKFHYEVDYKRVIKDKKEQHKRDGKLFHLNYEKDIEKKRRKWGEDSDVFRLSYALVWALDVGMFFTDADWDNLCNKRVGFPKKVERKWHVVAGLDIAKTAASTVLTIAKVSFPAEDEFAVPVKEIIAWMELTNTDYEAQHHAILDALIDFNVSVLAADYTGVGKPVVDRLMYSCGDNVTIIPYTFSRPSKSDMWVALQNDIRNKRIVIPANRSVKETPEYKNCEAQCKTLQKYYEGSYLVAEKLEGEKDDYPDSLGLMVIAGNTPFGDDFVVEDDDINPLFDEQNINHANMVISQW